MKDIKQFAKLAFNNRKALKSSVQCGCYYCLEIFDPQEIEHWIDSKDLKKQQGQTALCPRCGVDSVVPDDIQNLTKETLIEAREYWFKPKPNNYAKLSSKK